MSTAEGETIEGSPSRGASPTSSATSSATTTSSTSTATERKPTVLSGVSGAMQYLNPDYAPPLSVSLDVNNSPLAMLARTCNNIGKDQPPTAVTRIAPRGLAAHFQHHHHQHTLTNDRREMTGKSSSSPISADIAKKSGAIADVTICASSRKDFNAGVPITSRNKLVVAPAGVALGSTTSSPHSSSSSPPSASASRLPVRHGEATNPTGRPRIGGHDRMKSYAENHRVNVLPVRPNAVNGQAGIQASRRSLPITGRIGDQYDIYRNFNGGGRTPPVPVSKTISTVIDDGEEEDCNVEDSVDDEMLQDPVENEMETGNRSIGSSMEAIEHMMQRYVADVQAEAHRRGSVQRLMQQNREAFAFQTALAAAAAAAANAPYHQPLPQSALGLLGPSTGPHGLPAMPINLGGGATGRHHLPSGGLQDPGLYSALVAVAASQYHRQQQQQQAMNGDAVNGSSPTSTSTSSFCSPKDSANVSNEDRDSPSMACDVITDSDQLLRNRSQHQQQDSRHRRHQVRQRSNTDDGYRVTQSGVSSAAAGNTFSGLLLQAAAAANGFPLASRNNLDANVSVHPLPTSTTSTLACNWMTSSGEFCGRRFGSSDELLHHLQSHVLQGQSSSTLPSATSTDHHQLAAALAAAGLFNSPYHQYHCANAAAAAATSGIPSAGGLVPHGYPMLFGAGAGLSGHPSLPPHLVAALTNQGLASSLQSAAAFNQHRNSHQHHHPQTQQHRDHSATGKSPPPSAHGSSLLLHAAAVAAATASRYHPYKLPHSSPANGSAGAFSPLSRSGLHRSSPPGVVQTAAGAAMPSLAAYLSASPYGSSLYPAQRLGPAVGP